MKQKQKQKKDKKEVQPFMVKEEKWCLGGATIFFVVAMGIILYSSTYYMTEVYRWYQALGYGCMVISGGCFYFSARFNNRKSKTNIQVTGLVLAAIAASRLVMEFFF